MSIVEGVSIWWSANCTDPSLNSIQRNVPQSSVTESNEGNVVSETVTVFGNKEKYCSCTWRSVLPPAQFYPINSVCHRQKKFNSPSVYDEKKKLWQSALWTETSVNFTPEDSLHQVLIDRGDTEETPWKHTCHHHDVYCRVSLWGRSAGFLCE